jgi:hypothetical protein
MWSEKISEALLEGWFWEADGVFIQYRGVHGLPGTQETLIRMIE